MTVQFSGGLLGSERLYQTATQAATAPTRLGEAVDKYVASKANAGTTGKVSAFLVKHLGTFGKKLVDVSDFREFTEVVLGKAKFTISAPPIGAMILLLFPFTIGPRLYNAYKRGKKSNDLREVGDVLRRDVTAISLFLFLLNPLLKLMNKGKQKMDGLQLVDDQAGKVITYTQFQNYKIDSAQALRQMVREGNGAGILKAFKTLSDRGLSKTGDQSLANSIAKIQELAPKMVNAFENRSEKEFVELSEAIFTQMEKSETLRAKALQAAEKGGSAALVKAAKGLKGEFKDVIVNYAKSRRLPSDLLGFIICIGAIGYFPVWFNDVLSKKKFAEEQAKTTGAPAAPSTEGAPAPAPIAASPFNPQATFQSLRQSSRLAQGFNRPA